MARPFRSRKQQTRLRFQTLSGPPQATDDYSPAIHDRLAHVRYSGSTPRSTIPEHPNNTHELSANDISPEYEQEGERTTQNPDEASRFGGSSSSLSPVPSSPISPSRPTVQQSLDVDDHDINEYEDDVPLPSAKRRRLTGGLHGSATQSTPRRSTRLVQSSPAQRHHSKSTRDRTHPFRSSPLRRLSDLGSAETSDDDADILASQPASRRQNQKQRMQDDMFVVDDDHVDAVYDHEKTPGKSRRGQRQQEGRRHAHRKNVDDFMVDDDEVEFLSAEDSDRTPSNSKVKRIVSKKAALRRSEKEKAELEEDLLDLQDSDAEEVAPRQRTRGGPVTTKRDEVKEHLAILKRKRAGKRKPRIVESEEEDEEQRGEQFLDDSDEDGIDIENITYDQDVVDLVSDNSLSQGLIGAPELHPEAFGNAEEDDDDFIVDDTELSTSRRHNRPHPDIPLQFTAFASAKPKDLFIHIIEWMVKNKISPAFARDDDLFDLSFSRIDDQVKAQAGSRLISSAWGANFKYAILARPLMTVEALPGDDEDHIRTCDACNRSNHPARYGFQFSGTPYNKATLEPLDLEKDDSDGDSDKRHSISINDGDDDEETQSTASYDSQGHILASSRTYFHLGRYCAAAAQMGHKLTHWKHHLNSEVLNYLTDQDVLSGTEIIRRDKTSHRRREKEAENIVDAMRETGIIRELWDRFQDDLEDARIGMEGHEPSSSVAGADGSKNKSRNQYRQRASIGEWMDSGTARNRNVLRGNSGNSSSDSD